MRSYYKYLVKATMNKLLYMFYIISNILKFTSNIFTNNKKIGIDKDLYNAIKDGDGQTVGKIREKWKKYTN